MTDKLTSKSCFLFEFYFYFLFLGTIALPSFILRLSGQFVSYNAFDYIDVLVTIICACILSFFMNKIWRKLFFGTFLVIAGILNLIDFESIILTHSPFKDQYASMFFNSNWREISEFFRSIFSYKLIFAFILCFGALIVVPFLPCRFSLSLKKRYYIFISACFLSIMFGNFIYSQSNVIQNIAGVIRVSSLSKKLIEAYHPKPAENIHDLNSDIEKKLYIVVLSDSVSRNYLSLYGYKYITSPFLQKSINQLYVFDNVTTRFDWTHMVIRAMSVFEDTDDHKYDGTFLDDATFLSNFYNLFDVFKVAGFKVYWISANSQFDNYAFLISGADFSSFNSQYDEDLLSSFNMALEDDTDKKIIFLHLKGSHQLYKARYPEYYAENDESILKLKQIKGIDKRFIEYIKTLLYGDDFLNKLFSIVDNKDNVSSYILYLSDHGEDVDMYGNAIFMHGGTEKKKVFEIPFVLWLSDTYKKNNKEFVDGLSKNLHRPYEISTLNHSLLDLSRLDTSFLDKTKSIFNRAYQERPRKYDTLTK